MSQNRLTELWDDARDGTLSPQDVREFESLLAGDAQAKAMWDAESGWLSMLDEDEAGLREGSGRESFVQGVISQWQQPSPVVGRIGVARVRAWALGIAAALLLATGVGIWINSQPSPTTTGTGTVVVVDEEPDVIAMLMSGTRESYAALASGPGRLKETVTNPAALLDVNQLVSLLKTGVPDPADYVAPRNRS